MLQYLVKAILLSFHQSQSIGQIVVGLDSGKVGRLDWYAGCLDTHEARLLYLNRGSGVHLAVEAAARTFKARQPKPATPCC